MRGERARWLAHRKVGGEPPAHDLEYVQQESPSLSVKLHWKCSLACRHAGTNQTELGLPAMSFSTQTSSRRRSVTTHSRGRLAAHYPNCGACVSQRQHRVPGSVGIRSEGWGCGGGIRASLPSGYDQYHSWTQDTRGEGSTSPTLLSGRRNSVMNALFSGQLESFVHGSSGTAQFQRPLFRGVSRSSRARGDLELQVLQRTRVCSAKVKMQAVFRNLCVQMHSKLRRNITENQVRKSTSRQLRRATWQWQQPQQHEMVTMLSKL